jgi:hypothetical protein
MLVEHYRVGQRVRVLKNNKEIFGAISEDLGEMSYEITSDTGDLIMVDHAHIEEILP